MRLASDSAEPLPHAKTCNHWHTISSIVGLPLKTIYPSNFEHFGTSETSSLSITDGILLKATRAIVPSPLRPSKLTKIHHSHRGPEYCLRFARDTIFWPGMSKDIEEFCHSCPTCAQYGKQAATEQMLSYPTPTLPCQFVSQDIFMFGHKQYLATVDHYSDFYELDELVDTLSTTVINLTKAHFARHGIPLRCLADNGSQFVSHQQAVRPDLWL